MFTLNKILSASVKKLLAMFAVMIFIFSATTSTTSAAENKDKVITVTGIGRGPTGANPNGSFAKNFARQIATLEALNRLVEQTEGFQVENDDKLNKVTTHITVDENFWKKYFSSIEIDKVNFYENCCEVIVKATLK